MGSIILSRLKLDMKETMELGGVTDEKISRVVREGMEATRKYYASWRGEIVESAPAEDHPTRLKAAELAARIKGHLTDRVELTGKDSGDISLVIRPAMPANESKRINIDSDE